MNERPLNNIDRTEAWIEWMQHSMMSMYEVMHLAGLIEDEE